MTHTVHLNIGTSAIELKINDGKTITVVPHAERLYVGISGLGELALNPTQIAANSVDINYVPDTEVLTPAQKSEAIISMVKDYVDHHYHQHLGDLKHRITNYLITGKDLDI